MNGYTDDQCLDTMNKYASGAAEGYVAAPGTANYTAGVIPKDTLPAKWWNWFMQKLTENEALTSYALTDIYAELNNVLTNGGQTADNTTHTQLYTAIKQIINNSTDVFIHQTDKGIAGGVATLDSTGRVPTSQLTLEALELKGAWDPTTGTAPSTTMTTGDFWIVTGAANTGTVWNNITWYNGDWIVYDGTNWICSTNSNLVQSVNGNVGVVQLAPSLTQSNKTLTVGLTGATSKSVNVLSASEALVLFASAYLGRKWTASNVTSGSYTSPVYANGIWVICSSNSTSIKYSTDGMTWTTSNLSGSYSLVVYTQGVWLITGTSTSSGIYYSYDGKTWIASSRTGGGISSIVYGNGVLVASSSSGSSSGLFYSLDTGKTWYQSNIASMYFSDVTYSNGIWLASAGSGIYYSTDGKTWTASNITSGYYNIPVYANGIWVTSSSNNSSNTGLKYSTDGMTWTASNVTSGYYNKAVYANGIWVVSSSGSSSVGLYYSTDGMTWTASNITSGSYSIPMYANGIWVVGNNSDTGLKYSTDGMTWTASNVTSGSYIALASANGALAYANGVWVVNGRSSNSTGLKYSTDGKTWTASNITSGYYNIPVYANGIWVVGGLGGSTGIKYSSAQEFIDSGWFTV